MRIWTHMVLIQTFVLGVGLASACGQEQNEGARTGNLERSPGALAPGTRENAQRALGEYERIRAALAADDGHVANAANALAAAADAAVSDAPANLRPHLGAMAREARELAGVPFSDLPALRRQFGEVSRSVLALLQQEQSLARGLHAFDCPMAEGYGRWVQPRAEISNPYMGTRMPECGGPSEMEPE